MEKHLVLCLIYSKHSLNKEKSCLQFIPNCDFVITKQYRSKKKNYKFYSWLELYTRSLKCSPNFFIEKSGVTSKILQPRTTSWDLHTTVPFHQAHIIQIHNVGEGFSSSLQLQTESKISRPETLKRPKLKKGIKGNEIIWHCTITE